MKIVRFVLMAVLAINFAACKPSVEHKKQAEELNVPVSLSTINLDIKGMTCQIGCAKTIESKISKLEGVSESKVNFEDGKGVFVVDTNKTSKEVLISTINSLVGGETYIATESSNHSCKVDCSKPCCVKNENKVSGEQCSHKKGKSCDSVCDAKEKTTCSSACAEKCDHKEGESCTSKNVKEEDESCEKLCCAG